MTDDRFSFYADKNQADKNRLVFGEGFKRPGKIKGIKAFQN